MGRSLKDLSRFTKRQQLIASAIAIISVIGLVLIEIDGNVQAPYSIQASIQLAS
jgi:hypothetical protein